MITLSRINIEEVLDAKKILKEVWVQTYSNIYTDQQIDYITSIWHDPGRLKKEVEDPDFYFAVAKDDNAVVGVFTARIMSASAVDISRLYIKKEYQGQGIGTRFLKEVLTAFPNAKVLHLEVEEQNDKARKFYEKHRFEVVGKKKEIIQSETMDVIIMEKNLLLKTEAVE